MAGRAPRRYFGTDGVRGKVGVEPITPEFVMRLGYAAGKVLAARQKNGGERPAVLIGKDTRVSGYMLESALEAGLSAAGVDVLLVGPMPTPAVAYLTRALRLTAGIVISASHNPFDDNGIKLFGPDGYKLSDAEEAAIEASMDDTAALRAPGEAPGLLAFESAVDELAHALGMDPIELRVLNEPKVHPESGRPFSSSSACAPIPTARKKAASVAARRPGRQSGASAAPITT